MSTKGTSAAPSRSPYFKPFADEALIDELAARELLTRREWSALKEDGDLSGLYEPDCDWHEGSDVDERFNGEAAEFTRELIMRNDFAEALVQAERVHPHLDGLVRLSQRGA